MTIDAFISEVRGKNTNFTMSGSWSNAFNPNNGAYPLALYMLNGLPVPMADRARLVGALSWVGYAVAWLTKPGFGPNPFLPSITVNHIIQQVWLLMQNSPRMPEEVNMAIASVLRLLRSDAHYQQDLEIAGIVKCISKNFIPTSLLYSPSDEYTAQMLVSLREEFLATGDKTILDVFTAIGDNSRTIGRWR